MLDLVQLLSFPHVDTRLPFDLSPDGEKIAFSSNKSGSWEIYQMSLRAQRSNLPAYVEITSSQRALLAMTETVDSKFSPRYSPDGKYLACALDLDGTETYHIVLHDLQLNTLTELASLGGYAQRPNFAFSQDGQALAILADEPGQFSLYVMPTQGEEKSLVMDLPLPCRDVCWSPDSRWICVEAESTASDRGLFIVSSAGGEPVQIKQNDEAINAQDAAWSPDGRFIAFSGENGEWHDIGLYEVETKNVIWVNLSEGEDTSPCWSRDASRLAWVHAEGAATRLEVREGSGEIHQHQAGLGVHHHPRFTKDGKGLILLFESPRQPPDLWNLNLENESFEQLTFSMPDELDEEFIQPAEIEYPSNDGVMIPALLYRAKDSERAVVCIHGGPNCSFQYEWHPVLSYMASRGWTVLAPNYRGSAGYGKTWQNASRFDMGGMDTRDCAAAAKYLSENKLANEKKIAVTGRGYGGYLTMTCMTMFAELWAGGSAVMPFLNWFESHKTARKDVQHWNIENMGDPKENFELWYARSPYFFLDNLNAPVQLICTGNDRRCPASESLHARDKLVELGREVDLALYEGEGHRLLDMKNVIDAESRRIAFLEKALE